MKTIQEFIDEYAIAIAKYESVPVNKLDPLIHEADNYLVTIVLKPSGRQVATYCSVEQGDIPGIEQVLSCLWEDIHSVEEVTDYRVWGNSFRYNDRTAEKFYNLLKKEAEKMRNWLGDEVYNEFINEVEPG